MTSAAASIIRRQVDIDFASVPAPPWFPAGGPLEVMFNGASLSFPPTERFFIAAVRDYQDRIEDPVLREQVRDFIYQEAMHNKVHLACNAMLARFYPNSHRAEQVSITAFRWLGKLPRSFRLTLSSALEHFTSMVADTLLRYPDEFRSVVPTDYANMWLWHAAEETEHKSVCFDVHAAIHGKGVKAYLSRVTGMLFATPIFLFVMLLMSALALGKSMGQPEPNAQSPAAVPAAEPPVEAAPAGNAPSAEPSDADRFVGRNMFGLLRQGVPWKLYFSYYLPSFHPWNHDNSDLVAEWKERYPGFGLESAKAAPA
jgi:predicted metal-dependent hydrolase